MSHSSISTSKEDGGQSTQLRVSHDKPDDREYEDFGDEIVEGQNGSYSYSRTPGSPSRILDTSIKSHLNVSQPYSRMNSQTSSFSCIKYEVTRLKEAVKARERKYRRLKNELERKSRMNEQQVLEVPQIQQRKIKLKKIKCEEMMQKTKKTIYSSR